MGNVLIWTPYPLARRQTPLYFWNWILIFNWNWIRCFGDHFATYYLYEPQRGPNPEMHRTQPRAVFSILAKTNLQSTEPRRGPNPEPYYLLMLKLMWIGLSPREDPTPSCIPRASLHWTESQDGFLVDIESKFLSPLWGSVSFGIQSQ